MRAGTALGFRTVDERGFVEALMAAVPEDSAARTPAISTSATSRWPIPRSATLRSWLEDHAIKVAPFARRGRVRPGQEDVVRRFWAFVEQQAQAGAGDRELETLLQLECFEGNAWIGHLGANLGPRTRLLYNGEL